MFHTDKNIVVSSGYFHAFHVVFFLLEYILSVPPHSTYIIVNGLTTLCITEKGGAYTFNQVLGAPSTQKLVEIHNIWSK